MIFTFSAKLPDLWFFAIPSLPGNITFVPAATATCTATGTLMTAQMNNSCHDQQK